MTWFFVFSRLQALPQHLRVYYTQIFLLCTTRLPAPQLTRRAFRRHSSRLSTSEHLANLSALFTMPVHLGSRTKVHLVSADLRSTTTDEPSNKKAPTVTEHIVEVEQTLKNGHVLKESNIPLAGDSNPLHLLGGDEYMPFLFVRAGEDLRHVVSQHLTPRLTVVH